MKNYFIKMTLIMGEVEKSEKKLVTAENEEKAKQLALLRECHYEADFTEFPNKDAVWDGGIYVYKINSIEELSDNDYKVLDKYI